MQKPKIPIDQGKVRKQRQALSDDLEGKIEVLQREVKALQAEKKNLKEFLDQAVAAQKEFLNKKTSEVESKIKEVDEKRKDYSSKVAEVEKAKQDLEKEAAKNKKKNESEVSYLSSMRMELEDHNAAIEDVAADVKQRENAADKKEKENALVSKKLDEERDEITKSAIILNQLKANNDLALKSIEKLNEALDVTQNEIDKKLERLGKYASALDKKEADLIKKDAEIEKNKSSIQGDLDKLTEKKEDIVLLGRKNTAEATRLKAREKDLENRDTKLRDREKLFKTKIGG